jgi:hypothetical protein
MENENVLFARLLLADARAEASSMGIHIPKNLSCYCGGNYGANKYYEVYTTERGGYVWAGHADNAYHAKAKYIHRLMEKHEEAAAEAHEHDVPAHA